MPPDVSIRKRFHQPLQLRNLTATSKLPSWCSKFFKVPNIKLCCGVLWERRDSNPLSRKAADLQSAPTRHRWRSPNFRSQFNFRYKWFRIFVLLYDFHYFIILNYGRVSNPRLPPDKGAVLIP